MLAFDTETTGLLRPSASEEHLQPSIIEICVVKFDDSFEVIDVFESFVKPPVPISAEITKITNITENMVADAPNFIGIYDDLCKFFLGEQEIYAHNCSFDIDMLGNELARHGLVNKFPWPSKHVCTVEASFCIKNKRMRLGDLYKLATGREIQGAHRAKTDTMALVECIKWLKENGFIK
jgi:DNA polymerase-3 subunit alpha (Gram-positive type)